MECCRCRPQLTPTQFINCFFWLLFSILFFLAGLNSAQASDTSTLSRQAYVITLNNQTPETIIPAVKPLLNSGDGITGFGNELIITTDAQRINSLRSAVQKMDVALRNLLITVRNNQQGNQTSNQQGFSGGIRQNHIRIDTGQAITPKTAPREGLTVSADGLSYTTIQRTQTFSTRKQQQLRAVEGYPAFIYTGESRHLPTQNYYGNTTHTQVDAKQGFYIKAHLAGDRVVLTLSVNNDYFNDTNPYLRRQGSKKTQSLSTTVSGRLGEWINLGGVNLNGENSGSEIVKTYSSQKDNLGDVSIKITALD